MVGVRGKERRAEEGIGEGECKKIFQLEYLTKIYFGVKKYHGGENVKEIGEITPDEARILYKFTLFQLSRDGFKLSSETPRQVYNVAQTIEEEPEKVMALARRIARDLVDFNLVVKKNRQQS